MPKPNSPEFSCMRPYVSLLDVTAIPNTGRAIQGGSLPKAPRTLTFMDRYRLKESIGARVDLTSVTSRARLGRRVI